VCFGGDHGERVKARGSKLAGRVGTGFSEKLLRSLQAELEKIGIKSLTDCGEVGT
jgi:ATP-dependent DNA ligase